MLLQIVLQDQIRVNKDKYLQLKGILNKIFAIESSGQAERLGAEIGRHNFHLRQKLETNNEFNAFFTNCHVSQPRRELQEVKL